MLSIGVMPMPPPISTTGALPFAEVEMPGGRAGPQHVADTDVVMQEVRHDAAGHALDGNPIGIGLRRIGERVAADHARCAGARGYRG